MLAYAWNFVTFYSCMLHVSLWLTVFAFVYVRGMIALYAYSCSFQGILHLRGRPTVAYDQQGLVFAVAMEGGAIKLFDSRSYDKVYSYELLAFPLSVFIFNARI